MAINLDAIKAKLNQLQTSNNRTSNLWKPEPGKQIIRIVPYQHEKIIRLTNYTFTMT